MSATEQGIIEARLEWWRRASFALVSVIIVGVGAWFALLSTQVQDNRESIDGLHVEIASLRALVVANTQAQRDTTSQLATLTGQLEILVRLDSSQGRQEGRQE